MVGYQVVAGLPALLLLSCLSPPWIGSSRPWAGAAEFTAALRCNMTETEITQHGRNFPRLHLHQPEGREDLLVGQRGDTLIYLEIAGARLKTYQVSWTSGLTKQSCALKTNVCSGQELVHLVIVADAARAGAQVLLDGQRVSELSAEGIVNLDVPLGVHTLTIEEPGAWPWSTELSYDSSSPGCDRLPISEDVSLTEADHQLYGGDCSHRRDSSRLSE